MGSPFVHEERVRWIDCDAAQIIHYGSYIRFFEIAETEMYRSIGLPYSIAFQELDSFPIRAAYHCEYQSPARLDDLMRIAVWVSHWGTTSFTLSFSFHRVEDDTLLAEGYMRAVCVDRHEKRPVDIPDLLRERLDRYAVLQNSKGEIQKGERSL